ncbi:protein MAIN-LIKE 2-like [Lolium rigidum]|uniref:protein MAIN-LIKE 2-like n=1 Tax=Lolium rigidum TaxID=89674 RepID=UPI001F5CCDC5|nr:protein MAIN-LIKE 2-like [Lolium rigidum]
MDTSTDSFDRTGLPFKEETDDELGVRHARMKLACSPTRFANTIKGFSPAHITAIEGKTGLAGLLKLQNTSLRRIMPVRIAKRYNRDKKTIWIRGKDIPITETDVAQIMDLPTQGEDINLRTKGSENIELFNAYQSNGKLMVSALEKQIRSSTYPDDHFIRQFVLYAIGTILAPSANDYVDRKYLTLVENVADIPSFNWGCFTLTHLLDSILKFQYLDQTSLQGNLPLLQVWYWEHLRAGAASYAPRPPPLMARWDEANATLRTTAYALGGPDRGDVLFYT